MQHLIVHNVRGGLATNSSSSHSVVILRDPPATRHGDADHDQDGFDFGWDTFTATSPESKGAYLGQIVRDSLRGSGIPRSMEDEVVEGWLGFAPRGAMIDHQSILAMPRAFGGLHPSREFVREFWAFLGRQDVAILGGHDNGDDGIHPLIGAGTVIKLPLSHGLTARKDPTGFWTLFNPETGGKLRFSFPAPGSRSAPTAFRAVAPELVDMKITGFCPFANGNGCSVPCYQASDRDGLHAPFESVRAALFALARLEVFEIAIGGGEPTLHPSFIEILALARSLGIVPNFTTRNLAWMRTPEVARAVSASMGAFAYSVHRPDDIIRLADLLDHAGIDHSRAAIQVVMGTLDRQQFHDTLLLAKEHAIRVTLLGYKIAGRGGAYDPIPYQWWVDEVVSMRKAGVLPRFAIDTPLAAESIASLDAAGVPRWSYSTEDGTFSAYLDAVTWAIGPTSYDRLDEARPLPAPKWAYSTESDGARSIADAIVAGMAGWNKD